MSKDDDAAKAERNTLNDRLQAAKRSGSPSDLKAIIDAINQSSVLLASDKTDLIVSAAKALAAAEMTEEMIELKNQGLLSSTKEPLQLEITEEEKKRQEHVDQIYSKFDSFHKELLEEQKADNKELDKVIKKLDSGEDLSPEDVKLVERLQSKEHIERREAHLAHVKLTDETAAAEQEHHTRGLAEVEKERIRIRELAVSIINSTPGIINSRTDAPDPVEQSLTVREEFHRTGLTNANVKRAEAKEHFEEHDQHKTKLKKLREHAPNISDKYKERLNDREKNLNRPLKVHDISGLSPKSTKEPNPQSLPIKSLKDPKSQAVEAQKTTESDPSITKSTKEPQLPQVESLKNTKPQSRITTIINAVKESRIANGLLSTVKDGWSKLTGNMVDKKELKEIMQEKKPVKLESSVRVNKQQQSLPELKRPITPDARKNNNKKDIGRA